jgi:predicted  nucleic acid-binding Zn-ribbon protein
MRLHELLLAVPLLLGPTGARADAATETKLRDALRSTTSQLRALEDEKARWQKTEADLRADLETLRSKPLPPAATSAERKATAALNRRVTELDDANAKLRAAISRCEAGGAGRQRAAAGADDEERKRLSGEIDGLKQKLAGTEEKNVEMYRVSKELLAWLEKVGVGGEPFFGWKRNELENIAQEYGDKLLDQKVKKQ